MQKEIPAPIMFSPLKHHLYFLQEEIKRWKSISWLEVQEELLLIGKNLIDFYTGSMTVNQIGTEVLEFLGQRNLLNYDAFLTWLQAPKWKKIILSDDSEWLMKIGNDEKRFIHIHPAKFSKHSIRVRATTLKTVLALQIQGIKPCNKSKTNLENINSIRKNRLGLSPIKSLHAADSGILRLWLLFNETTL
ncbi:MAG TPA: hypothetical protein PK335_11985 [Draconibacterium sp.]|nr:hypothetical protein [Draconibacterium sp.]